MADAALVSATGRPRAVRPRMAIGRLAGTLAALAAAAVVAAPVDGPAVTLERVAGEPIAGALVAIEADRIRLRQDGGELSIPLGEVRRLASAAEPGPAADAVAVTLCDGGTIRADAFSWEDGTATVFWGEQRGTLPGDRVRMVAWPAPAADPPWLGSLPVSPDSDLVMVGSAAAADCIACAIDGVTAEAVTVVLDGERIPVKRAKVAGLLWLRPAAAPGGIPVALDGGALAATTVTWSSEALVLDDIVRLPAGRLRAIDFAAGRTSSLVDLPPELVEVEPFFGGLVAIEGLAGFFAPRPGGARTEGGRPGLVLRPRTRAVWRIPPDVRRFRAVLEPLPVQTGEPRTDPAMVTVLIDGEGVLRRPVRDLDGGGNGAGVPLLVEIAAGRRLEILCDFPEAGGMGGPVLLGAPVFEK